MKFISLMQGKTFQWTNGLPVNFAKWSIPKSEGIPQMKYDCEVRPLSDGTYKKCKTLRMEPLVNKALNHIQPYTANNTRLCASLVLNHNRAWVLVPCNTIMNSALHLCETTVGKLREYDIGNISPDVWSFDLEHGEGPDDFHNILKEKVQNQTGTVQPCDVQCHQRKLANKTAINDCKHGWIYNDGVCFNMFTKQSKTEITKQCIRPGIVSNIDTSRMFLLIDYLKLWALQDKTVVHLLELPMDGVIEYSCRVFRMVDITGIRDKNTHKYRPPIIKHGCMLEDIENLLCVQKAIELSTHCPNETFQCHNMSCISKTFRCDAHSDCPYGEDEYNCVNMCSNADQDDCAISCAPPKCYCGALYMSCQDGGCISLSMVCIHC